MNNHSSNEFNWHFSALEKFFFFLGIFWTLKTKYIKCSIRFDSFGLLKKLYITVDQIVKIRNIFKWRPVVIFYYKNESFSVFTVDFIHKHKIIIISFFIKKSINKSVVYYVSLNCYAILHFHRQWFEWIYFDNYSVHIISSISGHDLPFLIYRLKLITAALSYDLIVD